jgi:hypothetical protein
MVLMSASQFKASLIAPDESGQVSGRLLTIGTQSVERPFPTLVSQGSTAMCSLLANNMVSFQITCYSEMVRALYPANQTLRSEVS